MNIFIEFAGYPGSGKTFYSKKLKENLKKKKIKLIKADKYFFDFHSAGIINKLIYKNYYKYKQTKKFESKFLFKKQYKHLKYRLSSIIKKKKLKTTINNFEDLLYFTDLNKENKKRALDNFKIELCTYFLNNQKKKHLIYNDEGLVQKVYQLFKKNIKINLIEKLINRYLKSIPIPNLLILIDSNIIKSIKNTEKRNAGFKYKTENIDEIKNKFRKISLLLKLKLKNRTKIFIIKNEMHLNKQIKNIINYL
jgi:thymidylate kinase